MGFFLTCFVLGSKASFPIIVKNAAKKVAFSITLLMILKSSLLCFLHYTKVEAQVLLSLVNQFSKGVLLSGTRELYGAC